MERLFIFIQYSNKDNVLISPNLYKNDLETEWIDETIFWSDDDNPYEVLEKYLSKIQKKKGKLLIENDMDAATMMKIQDFLKDFKLVPLIDETKSLRVKKSDKEIKKLKKAAEIVDSVFYELIENDLEGKTEKETAAMIEYMMKKKGAEEPAFETIVASGTNAANPHHSPSNKKLCRGELVILDFGARYKGYCSDITRTIAIGECNSKGKKVYNTVKKAQETACNIAEKNIKVNTVDKSARDIIEEAGYGEYFTHRIGHGIGLDPHENPYLSRKNKSVLKNGMTFTIEPGIYMRKNLGIRIEDDMFIRNEGKRLTKADKDLKIV